MSCRLLAALALIAVSLFSQAEEVTVEKLQGLGELHRYEFASERLGRKLHIFVRLPETFGDGGTAPYPTVYLLDGGGTLPVIAGQTHYLALGEELPRVLLVGISYGSPFYREGNMRQTDFTAPAATPDFWGGAKNFQAMLADELMPFIEGRHPSDRQRRVLFGQSLGGQFVIFNALTRPELFLGHIASNPALHRNLDFFMRWQGAFPPTAQQSSLFVSIAEFDDAQLKSSAENWAAHWGAEPQAPWRLESRHLPGQTHYSALAESYTQGMKWLFPLTATVPQN